MQDLTPELFLKAEDCLKRAAEDQRTGSMIRRIPYIKDTWYTVYLTDGNIPVFYNIDRQGALFLLASCYEETGLMEKSLEIMVKLHDEEPENGVVALSLAEKITSWDGADDEAMEEVLLASEPALDNENVIEIGLLLCRAKAFRFLGMYHAARKVISTAMRRKKDRPEEFFLSLTYERALCYSEEGRLKSSIKEFEKIIAMDRSFKDAQEKLMSIQQ